MIVGCGVVYAVVYGGGVMIVGCGQWQGRMQGGGGGLWGLKPPLQIISIKMNGKETTYYAKCIQL